MIKNKEAKWIDVFYILFVIVCVAVVYCCSRETVWYPFGKPELKPATREIHYVIVDYVIQEGVTL